MDKSQEARAMFVAILFGVFAIFAGSALASVPREGRSIAVLTLPGSQQSTALQVIIKAEGVVKVIGQYSWVAVTDNDDENRVSRLYDAGALLVLDASLVTSCLNL